MANTNKLKTVIEPDLISGFYKKYQCSKLSLKKKDLNQVFLEMEPDLVAYDKKRSILYVGEITVSGYNGQRGKDYHVGAVKKLAESFSKFYLIKLEENIQVITKKIKELIPNFSFEKISCHFIVPKGSRFIKALGYRKRLFETGIMLLDVIPLSKDSKEIMLTILHESKQEMMK